MATIGTSKTLRDGTTIRFTRRNPTSTFKAIRKYLEEKGFELADLNFARTGSQYLSMFSGYFDVDVRCANHTQTESGKEVQLTLDPRRDNGIISINIDLSEGDMTFPRFKALFDEVYALNVARAARGMVADFKANGSSSMLEGKASDAVSNAVNTWLKDNSKLI